MRVAQAVWSSTGTALAGALLLAVSGCAPATPPARPAVELTLSQRSSALLPGWEERLSVRIGDITAGQVVTELRDAQQRSLAGPQSMRVGQSLDFERGGESFVLRLEQLDNALVGQDYARFRILTAGADAGALAARPGPAAVVAPERWPDHAAADPAPRIEALLAHLQALRQLQFVRNGQTYSAADAAQHLRAKWARRRAQVRSVADFISLCATRSELSGQPYRLRWPDGREMDLADYLRTLPD